MFRSVHTHPLLDLNPLPSFLDCVLGLTLLFTVEVQPLARRHCDQPQPLHNNNNNNNCHFLHRLPSLKKWSTPSNTWADSWTSSHKYTPPSQICPPLICHFQIVITQTIFLDGCNLRAKTDDDWKQVERMFGQSTPDGATTWHWAITRDWV